MNDKNLLNNIKKFIIKRSSSALLKKTFKLQKTISQPTAISIRKKIFCFTCKTKESTSFCILCGETYCKPCDNQIHLAPSNSSHVRSQIINVNHLKSFCSQHEKPLNYFCETCNEITCQTCATEGSHSNNLHNIATITESFQRKFKQLNEFLNNDLIAKQEEQLKQVIAIQDVIDKLKSNRNEIETEIRNEYTRLVDNLKREEGKKLSVLTEDTINLQREINKINEISLFLKEMSGSAPDLIKFMKNYKNLYDTAEKCFIQDIKKEIEVDVNDLPKEIAIRRKKFDLLKKMNNLLKVKDNIIWNLILDKKKIREEELSILNEKQINEINELRKYSSIYYRSNYKYVDELKKLTLFCTFCGESMNEENVNYNCKNNVNLLPSEISNISYIPRHVINNKRHYFVRGNNQIKKKDDIVNSSKEEFQSSNINNKESSFFKPSTTANTTSQNFNCSSSANSFKMKGESVFTPENNKPIIQANLKKGMWDEERSWRIDTFIGEREVSKILEKMRTIAERKKTSVYEVFQGSFKEFANVEFDIIRNFLSRKFDLDEMEEKALLLFFINNFVSSLHFHDSNLQNKSKEADSSMENKISMSRVFSFLRIRKLNVLKNVPTRTNSIKITGTNELELFDKKDTTYLHNSSSDFFNKKFCRKLSAENIINKSDSLNIMQDNNISFNNNKDNNENSIQSKNTNQNNFIPEGKYTNYEYGNISYNINNNKNNNSSNSVRTKENNREIKKDLEDSLVDWIGKVASLIKEKNINLYSLLSISDIDNDEMITCNDLKVAFIRLNLSLSIFDIDLMIKYFGISEEEKINIKNFTMNFMNFTNFIK